MLHMLGLFFQAVRFENGPGGQATAREKVKQNFLKIMWWTFFGLLAYMCGRPVVWYRPAVVWSSRRSGSQFGVMERSSRYLLHCGYLFGDVGRWVLKFGFSGYVSR